MKNHSLNFILLILFISMPQFTFAQFELWGTTYYGGANFNGNIFKTDATGSVTQTVYSFTGGADGQSPQSGLILASDGLIYGTTLMGGVNNSGVLFALDPATGNMISTFSFDGVNSGSFPRSDLFQASNGKIYGMAYNGGVNNKGTFFELDPTGFVFTKKADFNGSGNGANPSGNVLMEASNGKLYANIEQGGTNNNGVIIEYDVNTSTLTKKADFVGLVTGSSPGGKLVETSPGTFYGASSGPGHVFEFDLATSTIIPKAAFVDTITGYNPRSGLMQASNDKLYGLTFSGGPGWAGTLFEYDMSIDSFTNVVDFGTLDTGALSTWEAWGIPLEASNGKLYCISSYGCSNGSVFSYDYVNGNYEVLVDLFNFDGDYPYKQQLLEMPLQVPSVWPGDCNYDLIVNNYDFLNIGLAWSESGPVRPGATNNWNAQVAPDWTQNFSYGLNMKHADTNGDGLVTGADSVAILQNYGLSHPLRVSNPVAPVSIGDFNLVPVTSAVAPGQQVSYNLVAGNGAIPIDNLYGIAFRISFDTSLVVPGSFVFDFSSSLLGTLNTDMEVLIKNMYADGYIDIALSRTDHNDAVNVNGSLGVISFVASPLVSAVTSLDFIPSMVVTTTAAGDWSGLYPLYDPVQIDPALSGIEDSDAFSSLLVFPNPAQDILNIQWGRYESMVVQLYNITGKRIFSRSYRAEDAVIDISEYDNGIYQLKVSTSFGSRSNKLVIAR